MSEVLLLPAWTAEASPITSEAEAKRRLCRPWLPATGGDGWAIVIPNRGLRHLAIRVSDLERAREFYSRVFGMKLVWQPDPDNAYLSGGCDNLALHRGPAGDSQAQRLDHLGFIIPSIPEVEAAWEWANRNQLSIVHPLRHHRDGSVSFYINDPDGNLIQILYEPAISPLRFDG